MSAIAALTILGLILGFLLGMAAKKFKVESDPLIDELNAILPGTNCGQCGLAGCPAAAQALADGNAPVNLCPPGGKALAVSLAEKLGISFDASAMEDGPAKLARVNEELCIGCVKCSKECPTDAIIGAPKQIHNILDMACTGCGNCVDVCPTMCIELFAPPPTLPEWRWPKPSTTPTLARAA